MLFSGWWKRQLFQVLEAHAYSFPHLRQYLLPQKITLHLGKSFARLEPDLQIIFFVLDDLEALHAIHFFKRCGKNAPGTNLPPGVMRMS